MFIYLFNFYFSRRNKNRYVYRSFAVEGKFTDALDAMYTNQVILNIKLSAWVKSSGYRGRDERLR